MFKVVPGNGFHTIFSECIDFLPLKRVSVIKVGTNLFRLLYKKVLPGTPQGKFDSFTSRVSVVPADCSKSNA